MRWGEATDKEQGVGWEQATGRVAPGASPVTSPFPSPGREPNHLDSFLNLSRLALHNQVIIERLDFLVFYIKPAILEIAPDRL